MTRSPARRLQRAHFAFMRALLQGLDERASWERYLRSEGEPTDRRAVRQTIAWIKDEFAAAARREARPGTARLVRLDPERFPTAHHLPTLEDFAHERGLEDFSEAEQAEAYAEAFPDHASGSGGQRNTGRPAQRARVIARQLEALNWLETRTARDPSTSDRVTEWLNPAVGVRLERSGLATLSTLVAHINTKGARWWTSVPGVGPLKAARVVQWLQSQDGQNGLRIASHALVPRASVPAALLASVVPAGTALLPWEKFRVPPGLDGSNGQFRAAAGHCRLAATSDRDAVAAWLTAKGALPATARAYRKEAERLLLWCVLERGKALSSLSADDVLAFRDFLQAPPAHWCGPRHTQRWSMEWRPLEGPLSAAGMHQAMTVLRGMFVFLQEHEYVSANPFGKPMKSQRPSQGRESGRCLSRSQWSVFDARLGQLAPTPANLRAVRALRWLYATGLRLAEAASAKCGDLESCMYEDVRGQERIGWLLHVDGQGRAAREVPVPTHLVEELKQSLERCGLPHRMNAGDAAELPIFGLIGQSGPLPQSPSASGLAKAVRRLALQASRGLSAPDASQVVQVSAHWIRRSHASHALQAEGGASAVALQVVQNNLGHRLPATASAFVKQSRQASLRAMADHWDRARIPT